MTGVLNAVVIRGTGTVYSVTLASTGTGVGYDSSGPSGSISPSTINGATISIVQSTTSPSRLDFRIAADVAQSFFREIMIQGNDGVWRRFLSSGATFDSTGVNQTTWRWTTTAEGVASDGGWTSIATTRGLIIYL